VLCKTTWLSDRECDPLRRSCESDGPGTSRQILRVASFCEARLRIRVRGMLGRRKNPDFVRRVKDEILADTVFVTFESSRLSLDNEVKRFPCRKHVIPGLRRAVTGLVLSRMALRIGTSKSLTTAPSGAQKPSPWDKRRELDVPCGSFVDVVQ